jgi:hypothetical protein
MAFPDHLRHCAGNPAVVTPSDDPVYQGAITHRLASRVGFCRASFQYKSLHFPHTS